MTNGPLLMMMAAAATQAVAFMDIAIELSPSGNLQGYGFDESDFTTVGNTVTLPITGTTEQAVCGMNTTDMAFASGQSGVETLRMYRYDGVADWALVGNALAVTSNNPTISALSSTRVAFVDVTTGLRVYEFDGTDWAQVGNALSSVIAAGNKSSIASLTSTRVAVMNGGLGRLQTYDFDGSDWSATGNFLAATGSRPGVTALNSSRIARLDQTNELLQAIDFDGTDWTVTGSGLFIGTARVLSNISIAAMSASRIAFTDINNGELESYEFDGAIWAQVGNSLAAVFSAEGNSIASMTYLAIN